MSSVQSSLWDSSVAKTALHALEEEEKKEPPSPGCADPCPCPILHKLETRQERLQKWVFSVIVFAGTVTLFHKHPATLYGAFIPCVAAALMEIGLFVWRIQDPNVSFVKKAVTSAVVFGCTIPLKNKVKPELSSSFSALMGSAFATSFFQYLSKTKISMLSCRVASCSAAIFGMFCMGRSIPPFFGADYNQWSCIPLVGFAGVTGIILHTACVYTFRFSSSQILRVFSRSFWRQDP